MENDDDDVGYCRPPKKHRFRKGQSGNPKGRPRKPRPKISLDIAEILQRLDAELIPVRGGHMSRREVELRKLTELEIKGDKRARRLLDRLRMRRRPAAMSGVLVSDELDGRNARKERR